MIYTVKEVNSNKIVVEFENGSYAHVFIKKGWTKEEIEGEISRYIPQSQNEVPFDNIEDIPIKVNDTNDLRSFAEIQQERNENEIKNRIEEEKRKEEERGTELLDYKTIRMYSYPALGDQLDALYWSRNGNNSYLEKIDKEIEKVKEEYPKNMEPIMRKDFDNVQELLII